MPGPWTQDDATAPTPSASAPERPANPLWRHLYALKAPAGFTTNTSSVARTVQRTTLSGPPTTMCDVAVYQPGGFDSSVLPTKRDPVPVGRRPAFFATFADPASSAPEARIRLVWGYGENAFAVVMCYDPTHTINVRSLEKRFMEGLTIAPQRLPSPFSVGHVPAGYQVSVVLPGPDAGSGRFSIRAARGGRPSATKSQQDLWIGYRRDGLPKPESVQGREFWIDRRSLDVNDRPATMNKAREMVELVISGNGFDAVLSIGTNAVADPENELIRIAESLRFAPDPDDESTWFDGTTALP